MGAITRHYSPGQAAILALQAGDDLLLMPQDASAAFEAVEAAVKSGIIRESRIDESVVRVLALKYQYGLFGSRALPDESILGCDAHRQIIEQISRS